MSIRSMIEAARKQQDILQAEAMYIESIKGMLPGTVKQMKEFPEPRQGDSKSLLHAKECYRRLEEMKKTKPPESAKSDG